jgi:hypothetical protein
MSEVNSKTNDLEARIEEKSTSELQHSIANNYLTEEACKIACVKLKERGAPIPERIQEEVLEENRKKAKRNWNRKFMSTVIGVCVWAGYAYVTGQFRPGQQDRLSQSMLIVLVAIGPIWGWDIFGRKK